VSYKLNPKYTMGCTLCDHQTDDPNDAHFDYVGHEPIKDLP
jgi:hypothetical protein